MKRLVYVSLTSWLILFGASGAVAQQLGLTEFAGGRGGSQFADPQPARDARVSEVLVRSGDRVDSVQLTLVLPDGSSTKTPLHGGSGGNTSTFRLDDDEYIIGLSGRYGDTIDSVRIHTNKRTSPLFGGRGGDRDYQVQVPAGNQAVGFVGRAGEYLDALGLTYTPIRLTQARQTILAGGGGGSSFADQEIPFGAQVAEVRVRAGDRIDAVQLVYRLPNGRFLDGPVHGGRGGQPRSFMLDPDEYITGISGRAGSGIDSLRIHTNKRTSELFGGRGGSRDYRIDVPQGNQALGFAGRSGNSLDSVGLVYDVLQTNPSRRIQMPRPGNRRDR
jgi:hypothetical protein